VSPFFTTTRVEDEGRGLEATVFDFVLGFDVVFTTAGSGFDLVLGVVFTTAGSGFDFVLGVAFTTTGSGFGLETVRTGASAGLGLVVVDFTVSEDRFTTGGGPATARSAEPEEGFRELPPLESGVKLAGGLSLPVSNACSFCGTGGGDFAARPQREGESASSST